MSRHPVRRAGEQAEKSGRSGSDMANIFWALVVGFLCGVFLRSFVAASLSLALTAAVGTAAVGVSFFVGRRSLIFPVALALIAAGVGVWRMDSAAIPHDPALLSYVGSTVTLEGRVNAEPDARQTSVRVPIDAHDIAMNGAKEPIRAGVLAVMPAHTNLSYGAEVRVSGTLRLPAAFDSGAGRQFDYASYLAAQGVAFTLDFARLEKADPKMGNPLKSLAIHAKQLFLAGLQGALPEPSAAFAGGITVGDKRSIGAQLTKDFQTAGLIHTLVLSGYNITVALNAVAWVMQRIPLISMIRALPLFTNCIVVLFFIFMSGGASSAVRAGLMAIVAVFARFSRRKFLAHRALAVAATLIVVWNPYTLCFDPGFQLSALATLGLVSFTPVISAHLLWMPVKWGLREIAASTIGTQIAVLPLLLYQNGQLSAYALPANLLTLPLMPYAMFFSLIAGLAGLISGVLGTIVGLPAYLLLTYIIDVTQLIARLPYASSALPVFSAWWLAPAYACLFASVWYLHKKMTGHTVRSW